MHQSEQLLKHVLQVNSYTAPIHKAKGHLQTEHRGKVAALPSSHAHLFTRGGGGGGRLPPPSRHYPRQTGQSGEGNKGWRVGRGLAGK